LKLVAWRKKMLFDLHRRASLPSELLSLDLLRPFVLEKDEWFRTDSGTSYRLSKSESSLSCRKAHPQPKENTTRARKCQHHINDFHRNSQAVAGIALRRLMGRSCGVGEALILRISAGFILRLKLGLRASRGGKRK